MQNILLKNISILLSGAFISFGTLQAQLAVSNGSFEADGTGGNVHQITSWFEESEGVSGSSLNDESAEQLLWEGTNSNIPDAPDGEMWAHFIDRSGYTGAGDEAIYQNLGTWNTGDATQYTLSALLGDRSNATFDALTIEFFSVSSGDAGVAGDGLKLAAVFSTASLLASDVTVVVDGGASVATVAYSHDFAFNIADLSDGDSVWLRIGQPRPGSNQQSLIDNVAIAAIPEPSAFAMIVSAMAFVVVMRRRQR